MKLHWLQHVPFEGLGYIEQWAERKGAVISSTRLYLGEKLPDIGSFDLLVIMGGPMGIYDIEEHPWLADERMFIKKTVDAGKAVLGICLGAQLMAHALGARVFKGPHKEIGWFPIRRSTDIPVLLPEELTVFHWHGDTFETPEGAVQLAVSEPGINQGFIYGERAVALQFHMETTPESMERMIQHCGDELTDEPFIQSANEIRAGIPNIGTVNETLKHLLDALV